MGNQKTAMTSRYRKPFRYPDGFADVLRDFTREVLRDQPRSIPEFGANYFDRILKQAAEQAIMQEEGDGSADRMSPEQLQEYLAQVFMEADVDGSGSLSYKEFKTVIKTAKLNFDKLEIRQMLMEADEDGNGSIDYNEFLPVGVDIVQAIYARREAHADGSNVLTREQFTEALKNAELGLTRHEINLIKSEVDVNDDGLIDISEFDNVFFEMLVECISQVLAEEVRGADELTTYLLEIFRGGDLSSQGMLFKGDIIDLLRRGDFGLTKVQVLSVMSECGMDENGFVNYETLAPLAAAMIRSIWDQNADLQRAAYLEEQQAGQQSDMLFGKERQEIYDVSMEAFAEFDADQDGTLDPQEFKDCLMKTELLGRPLNEKEFTSILAAVDEDKDGRISYEEFLNMVLDVLQYFWEQDQYDQQNP